MLRSDYEQALDFIASTAWKITEPISESDKNDPLLNKAPLKYGSFMNSFDFHLAPQGPRLIEINMAAFGYTTVCEMYKEFDQKEGEMLE